MMIRLLALCCALGLVAGHAVADTLVAVRTISPRSVLTPADLALKPGHTPGALTRTALAVGLEAKVALYPGRPIRADQLALPALIERNQIISLIYRQHGLTITVEGRALGRGAEGDVIRVMNIASRSTVSGRIDARGQVEVGVPIGRVASGG